MFKYEYISLSDISGRNTSNVNYINGMFSGESIRSWPDISNWNVSNVNEMNEMFILESIILLLIFQNGMFLKLEK